MRFPAVHPLLYRDYVRTGCRPVAFLQRSLAAGIVGLILIIAFGSMVRVDQPDEIALYLVNTVEILACGGVLIHATATTALVLPTERATGALTVLLTTPRSAASVALGVLASRILRTLTEVLVLLPLLALAVSTLGGVPADRLLRGCLNLLWCSLFGSATGLLAGHRYREHRHALAAAIAILLLLMLAVPGLVAMLGAVIASRTETEVGQAVAEGFGWTAAGLWMATPTPAVLLDIEPRAGSALPLVLGIDAYTLVQIAAGTGAALLAAVAVARTSLRLGAEADAEATAGLGRREAAAEARGKAGPLPGERPLSWKESRPPRKAWQRWAFRVAGLGYVALVVWVFHTARERKVLGYSDDFLVVLADLLLAMPAWLLVLSVFAGAATFVAEERERGSLDLLRAAPLAPWAYVVARPEGTLRRAVRMVLLGGLLWIGGMLAGVLRPLGYPSALAGAILFVPLAALGGFALGAGARTVRAASQRAAGVVFVLMFVWPFLSGWLASLARGREELGLVVLGLNPIAAMVTPFVTVHVWDHMWLRHNDDERTFVAAGIVAIVGWGICALVLRGLAPHGAQAALDRD